ncbi:MAG: tetraacyldisaccharide 4'-kinase, partial [candidate division WS1 bacterium]|nr:tetraacyldisaccharide 4'-kinase [candidate division WS1 bacterium]
MPYSLETWWEEVTTRRGGLARAGLIAASWPYRLGLEANLALYRWRLKPRTRPALPVISVGNLSLGGAGKSTTVVYLARRLQALGLRPAVVTRGYRGQATAGAVLISTGEELLAGPETGDEAVMLARLLPGVPVAVGKRREAVITVLAARTPAQVVLLDDGFQYFRMQRLLDLVLIDASRASPRERLFPAGRLREPWDHLARADSVWLTHVDQTAPEALAALEALIRRYAPLAPPIHTRHRLSALRGPGGERLSPDRLDGRRVLALSGLGNPQSFELSLAQMGAEVIPCRFLDHHPYSPGDLLTINDRIEDNQPHLVVTTEKDAVKL